MSDLARYDARREGDAVVVAVRGEVDMSNAGELEAAVLEAVDEAVVVVVDLTDLDYLDSAGTRTLHRLASACRAQRQDLRLVAAPGSTARRLLDLVGMAETVTVADTVERALTP